MPSRSVSRRKNFCARPSGKSKLVICAQAVALPMARPSSVSTSPLPFRVSYVKSSGEVETDEGRAIGKATACAQITSLLFPEGLAQKFFLLLTLRDGIYRAVGTCTIISNNVPKSGLVLA